MRRYGVVLLRGEEHGFTVLVPELPGCVTEGNTVEEALCNARDAIEVHLTGLASDGEPLPFESESPIFTFVEVKAGFSATGTPAVTAAHEG